MRVITGSARGRRLHTLEGNDIVRPTTDRVKEALFSIIQFEIEGKSVLDLFAGSGQLGIEALSRGASKAVFVDSSRRSAEVVKQNLSLCGFKANVVTGDALAYLSGCREKFDIAFLDPPYASGILAEAIVKTASVMSPEGIIICESPFEMELPEEAGHLSRYRDYKHGKIKLTVYRP